MKNTFEECKLIRQNLLSTTAMGAVYKQHWGKDFRISEIDDTIEKLKKFKINPNNLTSLQMDELGFGIWSDENPMRLIPIWLYPFLTEDIETESISGSKHTKLSEIDNDCRFGCLAYGVIPKS